MKYIIDEKDLYDLISDSWELNNLYNSGVDNWEGYGEIDEDDEFSPKDVTDYIKEKFKLLESKENENNE